jgi:hypothetical protein
MQTEGDDWYSRTLGRVFGRSAPAISAEQQADNAARTNAQIIAQLQERLDVQTQLRDRYKANVDRLGRRPDCKNQALQAFAGFKKADGVCRMLQGKIDSLTTVTDGMHDMRDNARMFQAVKQSNESSARLASTLDVNAVSDVMAQAKEHMDDHRDISAELAGAQLLDVVDEDDEYAEMMQMIEVGTAGGGGGIVEARPAMTRQQQQQYDSEKLDEEAQMLELLAGMKTPASKGKEPQKQSKSSVF